MSIKTKADIFQLCDNRAMLSAVLGVKFSTITYLAFSKGNKYKIFNIQKKGGGVREITAPIEALKNIQKKIAVILKEIYRPPKCATGFINKKSILDNAIPHLGKNLVLNFDLKDFFPSITTPRVIGLFKAKPFLFNNEMVSTLAGLVCKNGSLPQGAPTSPIISNMVCLRMDKELSQLCRSEKIIYTRYADDITFSTTRSKFSKNILQSIGEHGQVKLGNELINIIESNYFKVNETKTRIHFGSASKYVTGIKINTKPNISSKFIRQVRAMINAWKKYKLPSAQQEYISKYGGNKDFSRVVRGKLAYIKSIKGIEDPQFSRLYNRFVLAEGKNRLQLPVGTNELLYPKIFIVSSGEMGTGFIIQGKLWTCNHVLKNERISYFDYLSFVPQDHRLTTKKGGIFSDKFDLAIVDADEKDDISKHSLEFCPSDEEVSVGSIYKTIGFPDYQQGIQPHITSPVVVGSLRDDKYGVLTARVNTVLASGSSGSPVLNEKNQVVGIVTRGAPDHGSTTNKWTSYEFLPIQEIRRFMKTEEYLKTKILL